METILVTGGAGFIGSNFVHFMLKKHDDIKIINLDKLTYAGNLENLEDLKGDARHEFVKGDICDRALVSELMAKCDAVVHFAAETHVDRSIVSAGEFIQTDVLGTQALLEAARERGVRRFVHISTDEVYGDAGDEPSKESDALMPRSPYAASKTGADRLAFSYFTTYGLPVIITRGVNNYGPFQYPEKLIPLFVTNAIDDKPLPVYGSGRNTRDWIFVDDHCDGIDTVLRADDKYNGECFNIGASQELSVLQITDIILEYLNKSHALIKHVEDRLGHVKRHAVRTDKIAGALGWKAKSSFEEAMEKTIRWYVENEGWWRRIKEKQEEYKKFMDEYYKNR
ncbi:MAG TPA: dTDP-glucose 4,6-dehydratase [bacterium]|nr:dTDP-glucose 4,6-dehydratase [bacterium]